MFPSVRWLPVVGLLWCVSLGAADDPKPGTSDKKDSPPATKAPDKNKYQEVRILTGQVKTIAGGSSEMAVEYRVPQGRNMRNQTEELTLAEDVKVLTRLTPEVIGDDGKAKKLPPAELAKLRDPKVKNAYTADVKDIMKGQTVEVHLSRLKDTGPKKPAGKAAKTDEKESLVVTMIVIVGDDRASTSNAKGKPGKN